MKTRKELGVMNPTDCRAAVQAEGAGFFDEWLAAGQPQTQLSISAVCNARCLFCSNRMNPFPIRENVFRDIEDVKLQLSLGSANYDGAIHMSDSLPGRISEGEAFLHPHFFEILTLVREKFLTNRLHFTTNASLLDEPFVQKLEPFRPVELNISLHSTQPKLWARIFRTTERRARIALASFGLLEKHHIDFTGTIVPLPRICGWRDLENTFAFLVKAGAKSIILWWPGFSEKTPADLRREIECPRDEFEDFVGRMQGKFPGFPVVPQPNLLEPRKLPIKRIMNFTLRGNLKTFGGAFQQVLWLVSEAAYPEISKMVAQFARDVPNEHHVFPVRNSSYGGNIRVSGLLMVSDFVAAGREALQTWPAVDLVLVPKMAFDAFLRDLQKTPAYRIPEALGRTTWLVLEEGSFVSLKGRSFVRPEYDPQTSLERMLKLIDESIQADKLDTISALVAAFPIPTSEGLLEEGEFRDFLKRIEKPSSPGAEREGRRFERLDEHRVACIEERPTADPSDASSRWVFFRRAGTDWKLEMFFFSHNSVDSRSNGSL